MLGKLFPKRAAGVLAGVLFVSSAIAQQGWTTRGFNNNRTSSNQAETVLNQSNVNTGQFGLIFTRPVDGQVYAQPLVVPSVKIGKGTFNVLLVATMHDSVYAYDADNALNTAPLWQKTFTDPANGITSIPYYYLTGEMDIHPEVGITSTPAVDPVNHTVYVVVRTLEGDPNVDASYHQRLHALDLATGAEKFGGPVELAAQVNGSGIGGDGTVIPYSGRLQNQRPALVLNQGNLYIASASHGDNGPYHGWLMRYNAQTLKLTAVYNSTPNGHLGGFWMSGAGMPIDSTNYIYATTGNGDFNPSIGDYGDTLLKLNPSTLAIKDYFTPYNANDLESWDADFGVSGPILIPGTNLIVNGSKTGQLYVVNSQKMGKIGATDDSQIVQSFWATNSLIFQPPVYWQGGTSGNNLYVWSGYDSLKGFAFNGTTFNTTPFATSAATASGSPGGALAVSSNGTDPRSAIVWASVPYQGDANQNTVPGMLRAFKAGDLTELWNSKMVPSDDYGSLAKFNQPAVVNGKVYVATFSNQIAVYGELPHVAPKAPGLVAEAGDKEIALTWTPAQGANGFNILRGPKGGPYTKIASVGPVSFYDDPNLTDMTNYAYVVQATNAYGTSPNSNEASDTPMQQPAFTGSGLKGLYFSDTGDGTYFHTQVINRIDPTIDFDWNAGSPGKPLTSNNFSTTWYGTIVAPTTGYYTFQTVSDDGVRLYVRNTLQINNWTAHAATSDFSGPVLMLAGKPYQIQLEYFEAGGGDLIHLYWTGPGQNGGYSVVPKSALAPYPAAVPLYDQPLNLANSFNLDGMSFLGNPKDGDIGYLFQTYAAELIPNAVQSGSPVTQFTFGNRYDGAQNLINCDGRSVMTPAQSAHFAYVLGASINGNQTGTFTLFYSDGSSTTQAVTMTDWGSAKALHQEAIAFTFPNRHDPNGNVATTTSIFRYSLALDATKRLVGIGVPNNTDMRIVSISVRR